MSLLITTCSLLLTINTGVQDAERPHLYFAYGSNLSHAFMLERLKDGEWSADGWEKSGKVNGPLPLDMGTYILEDYEFGYSLNAEPFGDKGTAGNIQPNKGARVYGILYSLCDDHLKEIDKGEDESVAYKRVALRVKRIAESSIYPKETIAWAYVGLDPYVISENNPDPVYVELLVKAAKERAFPNEYIEKYLEASLMAPVK